MVGNREIKEEKIKQAAVILLFYALKKWFLFHNLNLYCGRTRMTQTHVSQQESQR